MVALLILLAVLCTTYIVLGIKRDGLLGFFIELEDEEDD